MQHLICTARNLSIVVHNPTGEPITEDCKTEAETLIEMVLTTYQRQMELVDGNLVNIKKTYGHRIGLNIKAAQTLATQLQEWIKEAQVIQSMLNNGEITCDSKTE